jgi:hypothetical protein
METVFQIRFFRPQSDNRTSKTCPELRRRIQNPKWVRIFAVILTLFFDEAVASTQQAGKIFRVGFLDQSTASGSAILVKEFR